MIHGPEVMMKYSVIVRGRQAELAQQQEVRPGELVEFLDMVRNGTLEQFEEWYQLYK